MIVFVGEKPSKRAFDNGWTWESKRLASATLHDALEAAGITEEFIFINLFGDVPDCKERPDIRVLANLLVRSNTQHIVSLGTKVCRFLCGTGIPHTPLIHPAARGKIRAKQSYINHVKDVLLNG